MSNGINLGRVMAIVNQGAHAARQDDLEDAQAGIEKQTKVRKDVKTKLKSLKASDAEQEAALADQSNAERVFETFTFSITGRNEAKEVPKELAKNAQARKSVQQLDVDAEEQLAELQQDIRDTTESFQDSHSVVNGIQAELQKIDQASFDLG